MPPYLPVPFPGHGPLEQVAAPEQSVFPIQFLDAKDGLLESCFPSPAGQAGSFLKEAGFPERKGLGTGRLDMFRGQGHFPHQEMRVADPFEKCQDFFPDDLSRIRIPFQQPAGAVGMGREQPSVMIGDHLSPVGPAPIRIFQAAPVIAQSQDQLVRHPLLLHQVQG